MHTEYDKTNLIIDLLEQTTKLSVVSEFLKGKGLTHSAGSWDELKEKRLLPSIARNEISNLDLIRLLASAEECGKQHVFLYVCNINDAQELINKNRVETLLRQKQLDHLLSEPDVLLEPDEAKIVDVRLEGESPQYLVVKQVETRVQTKLLKTEEIGNNFHKIYEKVNQRAVSVAKLHLGGLLEVRITSHKNHSKYDTDLTQFLLRIQDFIPFSKFSEISLSKAKARFWAERKTNNEIVRYTDATVCNAQGNFLRAVTGSEKKSLSVDTGIGNSLDLLIKEDQDAYCADANLWFIKTDSITSDVHVMLNGDVNEFALPGHCSEAEYDYVLKQIRFFNR